MNADTDLSKVAHFLLLFRLLFLHFLPLFRSKAVRDVLHAKSGAALPAAAPASGMLPLLRHRENAGRPQHGNEGFKGSTST